MFMVVRESSPDPKREVHTPSQLTIEYPDQPLFSMTNPLVDTESTEMGVTGNEISLLEKYIRLH